MEHLEVDVHRDWTRVWARAVGGMRAVILLVVVVVATIIVVAVRVRGITAWSIGHLLILLVFGVFVRRAGSGTSTFVATTGLPGGGPNASVAWLSMLGLSVPEARSRSAATIWTAARSTASTKTRKSNF
jgi:hypothetical protein